MCVKVPSYRELSVNKLFDVFIEDPEVALYLPSRRPTDKFPYREFFFNVLNTVKLGAVDEMIKESNEKRFGVTEEAVK
jgi:hypothetical protein